MHFQCKLMNIVHTAIIFKLPLTETFCVEERRYAIIAKTDKCGVGFFEKWF